MESDSLEQEHPAAALGDVSAPPESAAYFEGDAKVGKVGESYVRKPLYSREGSNILTMAGGQAIDQDQGPYGAQGYVRQAVATSPRYQDNTPPSARGSRPAGRAGCRSARMRARSPRIPRGSCPTRLSGEPFPHCTTQA